MTLFREKSCFFEFSQKKNATVDFLLGSTYDSNLRIIFSILLKITEVSNLRVRNRLQISFLILSEFKRID